MIAADKRKAICLLHEAGTPARQIARQLQVSRRAVAAIIHQGGQKPPGRVPKAGPEPELLRELYRQCDGWIQRVHEVLQEKHGHAIKYSTLTRQLRQLGIGQDPNPRCARVPDEPGAEMQHDTTLYYVHLGDQRVPLIASCLYLRYSKRRYLQFYRNFNRFKLKCFLHRALLHWAAAPRQCIIDNTNLARLRGTGARAMIVPEMAAFARQYGFEFLCHAKNHPDRKAGEERSFWTVETNFLPGRTFQSLEDINQQALEWSTVRLEHRPQGKAQLIPAKAFEHEVSYLQALSSHLPAPYQTHERSVDQYGYIAFNGNYYWIPGTGRGEVKVLEEESRLRIYQAQEQIAEYPLAADGVKNQLIHPEGLTQPPRQPQNRKQTSQEEEKRLRALPGLPEYLDFCLQAPGLQRHVFLLRLFALSQRLTPELFTRSVARARRYKITDLDTLERIAVLQLRDGQSELPTVYPGEAFLQRATYLEGSLTDAPDLSKYYEDPKANENSPE